MSVTLSITETQVFTALRTVLLTFGLSPTNPNTTLEIIRGLVNRVSEPAGPDFVAMWPLMQDRLSMNVETWSDASCTGSIAGNVLTVSDVLSGAVMMGQALWVLGGSVPLCTVLAQTSGTPGGAGTYSVTPTPNLSSTTIYNGTKAIQESVEWTIQVDVHGPVPGNAADNARRIETLWRDQFAVDACANAGGIIAPLYCTTPRQTAFENAEMQYEERWSIDLAMQVNPVMTVPAQFASTIKVTAEAVQSLAA